MTWHELKPETRQVLLDAIDRAETAANSVSEATAHDKLPLIPEPLGLITLSRSEHRADPVAAMGCAVAVVLFVVAVLGLFIAFPPWVPGS